MRSLANGGEPGMQLRADIADLVGVAMAHEDVVDFGINSNTARIDERAWAMWEHVCACQGASPLRTAADVREFP